MIGHQKNSFCDLEEIVGFQYKDKLSKSTINAKISLNSSFNINMLPLFVSCKYCDSHIMEEQKIYGE